VNSRVEQAKYRASGSALLVTLLVVSLLLVMTLAFVAGVRLELRKVRAHQELHLARANARLGLELAVSTLQAAAGPDQRVTATADLAARNSAGDRIAPGKPPANDMTLDHLPKGFSALSHGTRYWTGVWVDRNPETAIHTTTPSPQLLSWLVSGNETNALAFTPDLGSTLTPGDSIIPLANNRKAVVLVSDESVGHGNSTAISFQNFGLSSPQPDDIESALDRFVIAPLVEFEGGTYAFWVGDEGVKARYNLADDSAETPGASDSALRARTAPRVAVELMTASDLAQPAPAGPLSPFSSTPDYVYDDYPFPGNRTAQAVASLEKVTSLCSAELLHFTDPASADERLRKRFHHLSPVSKGLLTNSRRGGLKQDLSLALEDPATYAAMFPTDRILPASVSPATGPKWSMIRNIHDLAGRSQEAIDLDSLTGPGISPTITELRLLFKAYPNRVSGRWEIRTSIAVGIANPYTVPLHSSGLKLQLDRVGRDPVTGAYRQLGSSWFENRTGARFAWWVWVWDHADTGRFMDKRIDSFKVFDSQSVATPNPHGFLTDPDTRFSIPAATWEPGEVKLFTLTDNSQVLGPGNGTITLNPVHNSPLESRYFNYDTGTPLPADDVPGTTQYNAWLQMSPNHDGWNGSAQTTGLSMQLSNHAATRLSVSEITSFPSYDDTNAASNTRVSDMGNDEVVLAGSIVFLLPLPHETGRVHHYTKRFPFPFRLFIDHNLRASWHPPSFFLQPRRNNPSVDDLISAFPYTGRRSGRTATYYTDGPRGPNGSWTWGGSFTGSGTTWDAFTPYHLPYRAGSGDPTWLSIAELQHVDLTADDQSTSVGHQSGLAVGNAYSPSLLPRDRAVTTRTADAYAPDRDLRFFDISYLLNATLFDGYFFSSYAGGSLGEQLPNRRFKMADPGNFFQQSTNEMPGTGPAASIFVEGAFNVNSTSHEAWAAVLASSIRVPVRDHDPGKGTPFPRSLNPGGTAEKAGHGDAKDSYTGYRRLTDSEVRELAWQIVRQVRQRGPFTSLGHFVNRFLVPASAGTGPLNPPASWGLSGALQSAIDATTLNHLPGLSSDWHRPTYDPLGDGLISPNVWPDAGTDYPALVEADNAGERPPQGNRSTGIPGILTQADMLQVLAPVLTARSDTFRIRAYGDVPGPDGTTVTRAWCEAIVQRTPGYIDPRDAPGVAPDTLSAIQNQQFGRRFEIVSFRWLQKDEI
jgi:hypothetical protein